MNPIPHRVVRLEDRPVVGKLANGTQIAGPLPEETEIVTRILAETGAHTSLVYVPHRSVIPGQRTYRRVTDDVEVLISGMWEPSDHRFWLHVSACGKFGIPSWETLKEVKDLFIGRERTALQVLPRQKDFINIHPNVLHMWCCLTEDIMPNFGRGGMV